MKKILTLSALVLFAYLLNASERPKGEVEPVWKNGVVGNVCTEKEYTTGVWTTNISTPRLEFFKAKTDKKTGLIFVCPGGGYERVYGGPEGIEVAKWANANGMHAVILWYRVPLNHIGALQDIQRGIRVARANADKWNIDPNKICVIGFSAGANLCARASTRYAKSTYKPVDDIDKLSCKPNLTCLIYPAYCDDFNFKARWFNENHGTARPTDLDYNTEYKLTENLPVDKNTPPTLIVQTIGDEVYKNSSIAYFLAMKKVGANVNLFMCNDGKHGFGMGKHNQHELVSIWPEIFNKWLTLNGFKGDK